MPRNRLSDEAKKPATRFPPHRRSGDINLLQSATFTFPQMSSRCSDVISPTRERDTQGFRTLKPRFLGCWGFARRFPPGGAENPQPSCDEAIHHSPKIRGAFHLHPSTRYHYSPSLCFKHAGPFISPRLCYLTNTDCVKDKSGRTVCPESLQRSARSEQSVKRLYCCVFWVQTGQLWPLSVCLLSQIDTSKISFHSLASFNEKLTGLPLHFLLKTKQKKYLERGHLVLSFDNFTSFFST